ncbi:MAG: hypothetical protein ACJAYK_002759 [Crocinitomicaceae bacterium]|jgi:hypothetical protein
MSTSAMHHDVCMDDKIASKKLAPRAKERMTP